MTRSSTHQLKVVGSIFTIAREVIERERVREVYKCISEHDSLIDPSTQGCRFYLYLSPEGNRERERESSRSVQMYIRTQLALRPFIDVQSLDDRPKS
jgi:hypothetical protein